jgi:hypothetical protein
MLIKCRSPNNVVSMFKDNTVLFFHEIDINCRAYRGETPLIGAVRGRKAANISLLCDAGADLHAKDEYGMDALEYALESGDPQVVQLVVSYRLREAVARSDVAECVRLVGLAGPEVGRGIPMTRLREAVHMIHRVCISESWPEARVQQLLQFLDSAGDPDIRNHLGDMSSLHLACKFSQLGLAQQLLARGASVSALANNAVEVEYFHRSEAISFTPLTCAIRDAACPALVRMLVSADSSAMDTPCMIISSQERTCRACPLEVALMTHSFPCFHALLELGAVPATRLPAAASPVMPAGEPVTTTEAAPDTSILQPAMTLVVVPAGHADSITAVAFPDRTTATSAASSGI